jgi:hypothetical protein
MKNVSRNVYRREKFHFLPDKYGQIVTVYISEAFTSSSNSNLLLVILLIHIHNSELRCIKHQSL